MSIKYLDTELHIDTFVPCMNFEYKSRFALDPDIIHGLMAAGVQDVEHEIIELVVDSFRKTLEETFGGQLPTTLKGRGLD